MELPKTIGGKYRPRSILGTGGTGTVYSVEHSLTGEVLALKVMRSYVGASADAIARFRREARAASQIRSQHVVRVFDADVAPELGGAPFLVMDLLEGSDLEQLSAGRPVNPEDLVEWFRQIALALGKAHRIGIVHRDLKPENLFLTRLDDGTPLIKILDFGIAKVAAESPGTTQSGQLFGTPLYMAPEQACGDPTQIGPATDLFALGQIAYKLLTGVPYRRGGTLKEMLDEVLDTRLETPSARGHALGADFDRWFLRACDPNAARRFASAHEQVEALARALGLPAECEGAAGAAAPPGAVAGANGAPHEPQPDSSGNALISVAPAFVQRKAATSARSSAMPTLPAPEELDKEIEGLRPNRWRVALFAVAALIAVPFVVFALARNNVPAAPAARTAACPVDSGSAAVAIADLPPQPAVAAAPAVAVRAVERVEPTTASTARGVVPPVEREAVRWAAPRASPPRVVVTHRNPADDDPLSDQK